MDFEEMNSRLSDEVDDYIDYWKVALENLATIYPQDQRSQELDKIMSGLKGLIGTHSISENISDFVSGNNAAKFDPYTDRLSGRLLPVGDHTSSPEKTFFAHCFDIDNKEDAAKLLRFIYMVEFESQTLHYALVAREWLKDEDIRLTSFVQSKYGVALEMKELSDLFDEVRRSRQVTDRLFNTHWGYCRSKTLHNRVLEMSSGLRAAQSAVQNAFANEKNVDDRVQASQQRLFDAMKSFQEKSNDLLKESDRIQIVSSDETKQSDSSMFSWFTPTKTISGISSSKIREFQSGSQYQASKSFMGRMMDDIFTSYADILDLLKAFSEREREREVGQNLVKYWHHSADHLIRSLLDESSMKNKLPELFYTSMYQELQKSTTTQSSLLEKLEQFFITRSSLISDGNWSSLDEIHCKHSPQDCLRRGNIAKFRKYMLDYKYSSKNQRLLFSRINKFLLGFASLSVVLLAVRSILQALPVSVQSFWLISRFLSFSLPPLFNLVVPLVAVVLIGLSWRNAARMKSSFNETLIRFSEDTKRGEIDRHQPEPFSLLSSIKYCFVYVRGLFSCFSSKDHTVANAMDQEGTFIGVRSDEFSSRSIDESTVASQHTVDDSAHAMPGVETKNYGRYGSAGGRSNFHSVDSDDGVFETVSLDDVDQDPTANNYR